MSVGVWRFLLTVISKTIAYNHFSLNIRLEVHLTAWKSATTGQIRNLSLAESWDTKVSGWSSPLSRTRRLWYVIDTRWRQQRPSASIRTLSSVPDWTGSSRSCTKSTRRGCRRARPPRNGCLRRCCGPTVTQVQGPFQAARLPGTNRLRTRVGAGSVRQIGHTRSRLIAVDAWDPWRLATSAWVEWLYRPLLRSRSWSAVPSAERQAAAYRRALGPPLLQTNKQTFIGFWQP